MRDYLLGIATLPALAGLGIAAFVGWIGFTEALRTRWGISFEAKVRDTSQISDYVIRHHIWWERSLGPVFGGGWYREPPTYMEPSRRLVNRWVGLGMAKGPCVMVFREFDLGVVVPPGSTTAGDDRG